MKPQMIRSVRKLNEEKEVLKKKVEELDLNNIKTNEEKTKLEDNIKELKAGNQKMKETENASSNDDVLKYKEFLRRAQNEYKSLEQECKKENEKHKVEINNLSLKRLETEEKYGQVVKERELFKEKEKVFMETFDALTRLNKIVKDKVDPKPADTVIDITG